MSLADRLATALQPFGAEAKKMFGGTCFMVRGHMVLGTMKNDLLVRVGKDARPAALKLSGARPAEMAGRDMAGYVVVSGDSLETAGAMERWIALALDFNRTMAAKAGTS